MKTVKDVADSMLAKNTISQEEYDMIKSANIFTESAKRFGQYLHGKGKAFQDAASGTGQFFKNIAQDVLFPATAVSAVGIIGKEAIVDPLIQKHKQKSAFETMKTKVPQLAGKSEKDLKDYFGVVKTFSPKAASNPLVAGALVNKMIEFGGVDHKLVQDLASIEAGLMRPTVMQSATESAAKSISKVPEGKDG